MNVENESPARARAAVSTRDEIRLQCLLIGPLAGTYLADLCLFYIDHAIVGRLGADELGAVGLSGMVFYELIIIGAAILSIVGVIVGNAHGAGDSGLVARAVRKGLVIAAALSVPAMILAWYLMDLLALTGQEPNVVELGEAYVHAALWMVPPSLGFVVLRSFVTGLSRPGVVTIVITLALPVNFALNWVLVFGALGIPALGVAGAGYASAIVAWLMFLGLVVYIQLDRRLRDYRVFQRFTETDATLSKRIWRLGVPVAGMTVVEGSFFNVVIIAAGLFGVVALAANQIVINTIALAWTIAMSFGEAAAVRVSQERGRGNALAAYRAGWISIGAGAIAGVGFLAALAAAPSALATVFIDTTDPDNAQVLKLVITLGLIGAIMVLFDSIQVVAARALRGLEDTLVPMLITVVGYWVVAFPLGLILAFPLDYGVLGLWVGLTVGIAITCFLLLFRWYRFWFRARAAHVRSEVSS